MSTLTIAILLFAVGAIILFAELLLPTGGVLGILGAICLLVGVGTCFAVDKWLGLGTFVTLLVLSPMVAAWFVRMYPKTAIGRRMILQEETTIIRPPPVHIGQAGVAVSQLRPSGEVEFDSQRVEVIAETGIIEPGSKVKVVAIDHGRPVVRQIV